jgi:hypothetical protein
MRACDAPSSLALLASLLGCGRPDRARRRSPGYAEAVAAGRAREGPEFVVDPDSPIPAGLRNAFHGSHTGRWIRAIGSRAPGGVRDQGALHHRHHHGRGAPCERYGTLPSPWTAPTSISRCTACWTAADRHRSPTSSSRSWTPPREGDLPGRTLREPRGGRDGPLRPRLQPGLQPFLRLRRAGALPVPAHPRREPAGRWRSERGSRAGRRRAEPMGASERAQALGTARLAAARALAPGRSC